MKTLFLACLVFSASALADRSIEDSSVELLEPHPARLAPGETATFSFLVLNGSQDEEWIREVRFRFEAGMTITAMAWNESQASFPWEFSSSGTGDTEAIFSDSNGGYGEIMGGEGGEFLVEVRADAGLSVGPSQILWTLEGDGFGNAPHQASGELTFSIAPEPDSEASSWSEIKAAW
ncbi:MAG: hypothetical protein QGG80_01025 [Candidatus Krumholzibacteria bacterium]|jgi:hypothetical protein|nr:hypothetical protein [Candidatus Krumholzibacteria bacterium]MDP6797337.1 hypothetical protein [Candidatus Krumholzibacteria bacterium]MDP7021792.1 hypothetical protein [Candidatus Krumholzibacteria bacterium]